MMPTCEPRLDQSSISYILNLQCLSVYLSGQFPGTARTFVFFALPGPLFFFFDSSQEDTKTQKTVQEFCN